LLQAFDLSAFLPQEGYQSEAARWQPPGSELDAARRGAPALPSTPPIAAPVYSAADRDVEPPVPLKPKIETVLPADERVENLSVIDVVISVDGEVDLVKLVRPVRGVREAMMLSAVKAWRFRPARKDGQPVAYQKRIWIRVSPIGGDQR
jgi:hypothetical protein